MNAQRDEQEKAKKVLQTEIFEVSRKPGLLLNFCCLPPKPKMHLVRTSSVASRF